MLGTTMCCAKTAEPIEEQSVVGPKAFVLHGIQIPSVESGTF